MDNYSLLLSAVTLSVIHAFMPNHWLPFVLVGRVHGWERRKTLTVLTIAAVLHTTATAVLGAVLNSARFVIEKYIDLTGHVIPAMILLAFGSAYIILELAHRGHHHHHIDEIREKISDKGAITGLFLILTFSPCEAMIPVFLAVDPWNVATFIYLAVVMAVSTTAVMLILTWLSMKGFERIRLHWLEHHERIVIGVVLILLSGLFLVV
ncbi:MAG: hypothetical protein FJ088_05055 [Deltaproteobacteria bacterium]|nr:hypothetical protein [Deltaproteobacteria bacterium]